MIGNYTVTRCLAACGPVTAINGDAGSITIVDSTGDVVDTSADGVITLPANNEDDAILLNLLGGY